MKEPAAIACTVTRRLHTASFSLRSEFSYDIGASLMLGEAFRRAVMGRARAMLGKENIPWQLSGHDLPPNNRHGHAFYLPEDRDGDGIIDHFLVYVLDGMGAKTRFVLENLSHFLPGARRAPANVAFEGIWHREFRPPPTTLHQTANLWRSVTPYLHPWFRKPKLELEDQIRRECEARYLPEPMAIRKLKEIRRGGRCWRVEQFHRCRERGASRQPDRQGRFIELQFAEPVTGPLALGYACHYGLGLFEPVQID